MASPRDSMIAQQRVLMHTPRSDSAPKPQATRELSPSEILAQPSATLSKILTTLDKFVDELHNRAKEGAITLKDVRALSDLVKAHSTLRQTQLAEDSFARQVQQLETDADVAKLLIEAVQAGGPSARQALMAAVQALEELPP